MSTATATRTVKATCACGASFEREVKRGRPQVWCPSCLGIPFAKREHPVVVTEEGVVTDAVVAKPINENDPLGNVREQLEADVKAFYADNVGCGGDAQMKGLQAIYAKYRNN